MATPWDLVISMAGGALAGMEKGAKIPGYAGMEVPDFWKTGIGSFEEFLNVMTPEEATRFYMQTMYPQKKRMFQEEIMPGISEAFAKSGYWGEPRMRAEAGGWQKFGEQTMTDIGQFFQTQQQMALTALGMLPDIMGGQIGMYQAGRGVPSSRVPAGGMGAGISAFGSLYPQMKDIFKPQSEQEKYYENWYRSQNTPKQTMEIAR